MESRFAHLRQRDTSVSMLRVKMSRRRSQSQKENRQRTVNTRRQLEKLQELEMSSLLDASVAATSNASIILDKKSKKEPAITKAQEERLKQLERWKERKALEKEKDKRERERKGVFKIGLYQPNDARPLPAVPAPSAKLKERKVNAAPPQNTRVTRSMKQRQQEVEKPLTKTQHLNVHSAEQPATNRSARGRPAPVKPAPIASRSRACKDPLAAARPAVQAPSTRSANKVLVTKGPGVKDKPKDNAKDVKSRPVAVVVPVEPSCDSVQNCNEVEETVPSPTHTKEEELSENQTKETAEPACPPHHEQDDMQVDEVPQRPAPSSFASRPSFAPAGFKFQAPVGLSTFKFEPLTPRSADAFLTPSPSLNLSPGSSITPDPLAEPTKASPARQSPVSPLEAKHDVLYFRSEIASETQKLTSFCLHWEAKVEDQTIPEDMRDRMRTAVGQARLLMKERFNQFSGLVDDCELGRGEKVTTCSDLQGFWDMVFYQVEDVNKKFESLSAAESRGWVEEQPPPPPPRQRKVLKKPSAAPAKPAGSSAAAAAAGAAKSRLAAIKAAMKAKQQAAEAERAAQQADLHSRAPRTPAQALKMDTVVFDGGFFKVESPAKAPIRKSGRLSAAALPQPSPRSSYLSPGRVTRQSLASEKLHLPSFVSPAPPSHLALRHTPTPKSQRGNGLAAAASAAAAKANTSLCHSPALELRSRDELSEANPEESETSVRRADGKEFPLSPKKSPPSTPAATDPRSALSFSLTPPRTQTKQTGTPPSTLIVPASVQPSICDTPSSPVVEEIPGLDFERYLQPSSVRSSMSPGDSDSRGAPSPVATDVEMESPRGEAVEPLGHQDAARSVVSSVLTLQSPQVQSTTAAATEALLLFTPNLKDRIRQSVCPSDLMTFTPPNM